jgi:hypothetical protein
MTTPEFRQQPGHLQLPSLAKLAKASETWLIAGQLQTWSVCGVTEWMQPQLGLHRINVEEVDHCSGPGRWQGFPGGLSRQQQLGRELQA